MLLRINDLWSGYGGAPILQGISLEVAAGEFVGVFGPNGVGKTTLMRTVMGLLSTDRGELSFQDTLITRKRAEDRSKLGIAYVPQGRDIFPKLSVKENLLVGLYAHRRSKDGLDKILDQFPTLVPKLHHKGGSLSGGQQQLLALGRALIVEPELLLLDEPSEGIQPSLLDEISDVLKEVAERDRISVLLVEQNLDFAGDLVRRGYMMAGGMISRSLKKSDLAAGSKLYEEFFSGDLN